jgi:hypothetical protein
MACVDVLDRNGVVLVPHQRVRIDDGVDVREGIVRSVSTKVVRHPRAGYLVSVKVGDWFGGVPNYFLEVVSDGGSVDSGEPEAVEMLARENVRLRKAGAALCEAALRVASEYDGLHRLMLAVSDFTKAMADEHGRGDCDVAS